MANASCPAWGSVTVSPALTLAASNGRGDRNGGNVQLLNHQCPNSLCQEHVLVADSPEGSLYL